jgi:hypothetical protein
MPFMTTNAQKEASRAGVIRTSKYLTCRRMRRNLLGVYCRLCSSERKRPRTEEGSHLSLICQNVWRPRSVRLR